jgi:hypothetical protein
MMDAAEVPEILGAIYQSVVFLDRRPQALERLGQAFNCNCVALPHLLALESRVDTSGVDASSHREFLDVWSARDLVRLRSAEEFDAAAVCLMMGNSPESRGVTASEDRDRAVASGLDLPQDRHQPPGRAGQAVAVAGDDMSRR